MSFSTYTMGWVWVNHLMGQWSESLQLFFPMRDFKDFAPKRWCFRALVSENGTEWKWGTSLSTGHLWDWHLGGFSGDCAWLLALIGHTCSAVVRRKLKTPRGAVSTGEEERIWQFCMVSGVGHSTADTLAHSHGQSILLGTTVTGDGLRPLKQLKFRTQAICYSYEGRKSWLYSRYILVH